MELQQATRWQRISLIGYTVFLELIRKKELYVLAILGSIYFLLVTVLSIVGIDRPSTATFLLNLGLTLSWVGSHLLVIIIAARQVPDDLENRTIFPLLAKPVTRTDYLLGKWVATTLSGILIYTVFTVATLLIIPKMEFFSQPLFVQLFLLQVLSLATISSVTLLFSVILPRGVPIIVSGLLLGFGGKTAGFLAAKFMNTPFEEIVKWLCGYIPDFSKLNLINRYTDGVNPLDTTSLLILVFYGLLLVFIPTVLGCLVLQRRSL